MTRSAEFILARTGVVNEVLDAADRWLSARSSALGRDTAVQGGRQPSHNSACRTNGAPAWGQARRSGSWFMPHNFLFPQRDQLLLPADMREWLPEDDLVLLVLDAVATLDALEHQPPRCDDGWNPPRHGGASSG